MRIQRLLCNRHATVLIETYWNVNVFTLRAINILHFVLIETYWNVNEITLLQVENIN